MEAAATKTKLRLTYPPLQLDTPFGNRDIRANVRHQKEWKKNIEPLIAIRDAFPHRVELAQS
jgi:hypothetical protein